MFADLIDEKFKSVDTGDREIGSEISEMIMKGVQFGKDEQEELEPSVAKVVDMWFDENMDTMVGMYLDEFSAEEIIEMIDTVHDESYLKKLKFHMTLQTFMMEGLIPKMLDATMEEEEMNKKEGAGFLQALEDLSLEKIDNFFDNDNESKVWDTKE